MKKKYSEALRPFLAELREAYRAALLQAGHTREWPFAYIAALIATHEKLRRIRIDGRRLSRALGSTKGAILLALVRRTTDRDSKTRSRWCRVAMLAITRKIDEDEIIDWIRSGGGLAGRAREAARPFKTP